jgi:hypothetical protein
MSTSVLRWILRDLIKNTRFFIKTLFHTYRFTVTVPNFNLFPISVESLDGTSVWISRNSLKQGLIPSDLDGTLEDDRLRNPMQFGAMVRKSSSNRNPIEMYQSFDYELETIDEFDPRNQCYQLESVEIERGIIFHGRALVKANKILALSNRRSVLYPRIPSFVNKVGEKYKIFRIYRPGKSVDSAIYFGTTSNWFHFIVEGASRMVAIPEKKRMGIPVVLEENLHPNILELCFLLTNSAPIQVPIGGSLEVENLTVVREFGVADPIGCRQRKDQLIEFSRIVVSSVPNDMSSSARKIYIRRAQNLYRPLQNEREIEKVLHSAGFISIYPETYSLKDFINVIRSAEIVVAESGAAITNLMFAKPGTRFIELLPAVGLAGFWEEFVEIFDIHYSAIRGTSYKFGPRGYAYDGYKISTAELSSRVFEV